MSAPLPTAAEFVRWFGQEPAAMAHARGRVNLMGEHTDYNEGLVLPVALAMTTVVLLAPRGDRVVRAVSTQFVDDGATEFRVGEERARQRWIDHVQGVTVAARRAGHDVPGFDVLIASPIPRGAGLASSAALAVAIVRALRAACGWTLDDLAVAKLAQQAEHDVVGAPVGIMDQLAAGQARPGVAMLIDTRSLAMRRVPLPRALELVVIDSGVHHDHGAGDYRTRRAECERAAALLGVPSLRAAEERGLDGRDLPAPLDRRVRHVITENQRVRDTATALARGDLAALPGLFAASHRSLRDDFEASVPAVDRLVALAIADPAIVAARLTGGGFGGAIVALAQAGAGAAAAARIVIHGDPAARTLIPEPTP